MPTANDIAHDPAYWRSILRVDTDAGPRRLAEVLDPWQAADFEALDEAWLRVAGRSHEGITRAYLERPRGHSKTSDLAVMVVWALLFSARRLSGVAAAADTEQAALLVAAINRLVFLNPSLAKVLDVQRHRVVNLKTGSELVILSSDAASSFGQTPDLVLCDELTHWKSDALWVSLFSAAAKRAHCLLVIISNAGFGMGQAWCDDGKAPAKPSGSWQWNTREAARTSPGWYFSRLDGPQASWITSDRLAEQERLLPAIAYRRLWLNQWTGGSGDALDEELLKRATVLGGPAAAPERGWRYNAGLDLGLARDSSALVTVAEHVGWEEWATPELPRPTTSPFSIMADLGLLDLAPERPPIDVYAELVAAEPGTGKLRLVSVQTWRPPKGQKLNLTLVEEAIAAAHQRLGLAGVSYDPWQAAHLAQRLTRLGVPMIETTFTGDNLRGMCSATLEAFNESRLELFEHGELLADLRALTVVDRVGGCVLKSPRDANGHGDRATALALALLGVRRCQTRPPATVAGPLIVG